jgi:hypothetical protein
MTDTDPHARQMLTDYAAQHGRPLGLGHSTVSHRDLGYCSACVREGGRSDGVALELNGWRLLAMAERGMVDWTRPGVIA